MIDLIRSMFSTPEAQADAYTWAAVLLAHAMIGAMLTAILAALNGDRGWRAAAIVSTLYGLIWEGGQLLLSGSEIWDSVLDWVAVSCGAALCAAIWLHRRCVAAAVAGALLLILSIGAGKRR